MLIIGFGHKARRGKNSAAQAIIDARGGQYDIRQFAFADVLKKEALDAAKEYGSVYALMEEWHRIGKLPGTVQYDPDPDMSDPLCPWGKQRQLLQWWGTEYRRSVNPFYWVHAMGKTIDAAKPQVALITDMRFFNEMYWIKKTTTDRTGFCVRLDRLGFDDGSGKTNSSHPSETELDVAKVDGKQYDYAIEIKDGDIDELRVCAVRVFDMIADLLQPPTSEDLTLEALEAASMKEEEVATTSVQG